MSLAEGWIHGIPRRETAGGSLRQDTQHSAGGVWLARGGAQVLVLAGRLRGLELEGFLFARGEEA